MQEKHLNHLPRKSSKLDVVIEDIAHELGLNGDDGLIVDSILEPCTVVIVGASGDLAGRKLLPSLFRLYLEGGLPAPFTIVGCSRTKWDDEKFKARAREAVMASGNLDEARWNSFAANLFYHGIEYDEPQSFEGFTRFLRDLDKSKETKGNRIFYLAIPPTLYETTAQMLGQSGLSAENQEGLRLVKDRCGKTLWSRSSNGHLLGPKPSHAFSRASDFQN